MIFLRYYKRLIFIPFIALLSFFGCEKDDKEGVEKEACPALAFTYSQDGDTHYFHADFEGLDSLGYYIWQVDDLEVDVDGINNEGDNRLAYTFAEPGIYSVCRLTETECPECPEGISFFEEILIQ